MKTFISWIMIVVMTSCSEMPKFIKALEEADEKANVHFSVDVEDKDAMQ